MVIQWIVGSGPDGLGRLGGADLTGGGVHSLLSEQSRAEFGS